MCIPVLIGCSFMLDCGMHWLVINCMRAERIVLVIVVLVVVLKHCRAVLQVAFCSVTEQ